MQPATPGFIVAMLTGVLACMLTAPPTERVLELFDRATAATA